MISQMQATFLTINKISYGPFKSVTFHWCIKCSLDSTTLRPLKQYTILVSEQNNHELLLADFEILQKDVLKSRENY